MDFIKKHFEKILLALTLVTLIAVAAWLAFKVNELSQQVLHGRLPMKVKPVQTNVMTQYQEAITRLQLPSIWPTNAIDPFGTELKLAPPPPPPPPPTTNVVPFTLTVVNRKHFKLKFKAYRGTGTTFQVDNITRRGETFFIEKVGDRIAKEVAAGRTNDTGFVVTKFEHKEKAIAKPGMPPQQVDVSELTIRRGDEDPIVLVLDTVTEEREPEAIIVCVADGHPITVRKSQTVNCGGKSYNVVDITSTQVILLEEFSKEKHTINLPGAKE